MKISVENLGTIKKGEISLDKELTIFTGENNSGKSYMSYLCYGILDLIPSTNNAFISNFSQLLITQDFSIELSNGIQIDLKKIISFYCDLVCNSINVVSKDIIPAIFGHQMPSATFNTKNAEIIYWNICYKYFKDIEDAEITAYTKKYSLNIKDNFVTITTNDYNILDTAKALARIIMESMSNLKKYFIPAERTAMNMFYNDIVKQKSLESEELVIVDNKDEMMNKIDSLRKQGKLLPYAPLSLIHYIGFAYDFRKHILNSPTEFADLATELENLLGGGVGVSGFGDLQFQPTKQENQIPLYLSSSLVKSWSGVVIYLRHLAQKGDILMIDEPEINLHPKSQVLIARFLAKMVNRGIRIVVSTHSDYILRELSTLIIANNKFEGKEKLLARYPEYQNQGLAAEKVGVYNFANHTIEKLEITTQGIEVESINNVIQSQTEISDAFYYTYLNCFETEIAD